jgi:hypothetical protein
MRQLVYWHSMIRIPAWGCIKKRSGGCESDRARSDAMIAGKTGYRCFVGTHLRLITVLPSPFWDSACPISLRSMQGVMNCPVMTWTFLFPVSSSVSKHRMKSLLSASAETSSSGRVSMSGFFRGLVRFFNWGCHAGE